jgi:NTP pyrophosphatase (non-canonical NTP hydrolase)
MQIDISEVLAFSSKISDKRYPILASMGKLTEEVGEFAEATLVSLGYINKELKEPYAGELADCIICLLDVYSRSNPLYSDQDIADVLNEQLRIKVSKWKSKYPDLV